ncbi:hypothetical protein [Rhizohabitans arisaemae]|uniref:hypothetical protein n=1 Tax=Rhizohabitans arisaemae TaxID=2720610 RepID=UPI0024B27731|nr:hypothetical protein [Rhizohabitans arisaemae]
MFRRRTTIAAVGATLITVLGGGAAVAEQAELTAIPKGFLLLEPKVKPSKPGDEERWEVDSKLSTPFPINPCAYRKARDVGRVAARTIGHFQPTYGEYEQLVVYRSTAAAKAAFAGLQADLRRCRTEKLAPGRVQTYWTSGLAVGDRGLRVRAHETGKYGVHGERGVAVRRGKALIFYTDGGEIGRTTWTQVKPFEKSARKMAAKVCAIRGVCA